MAPFPSAYSIPNEIKALVHGKKDAPNFMDMILKLSPARARTNAEMYHLSFKTKLFLEEEAGILKQFDQFNRNNVRIESCGNNIFRFKVHVSIKLPYLFINFTNTLYFLT